MRSPGCGLPGDEKHAQLVPHAVDIDDRAVAVGRQFAFDRSDLELDHIGTCVVDPRLDVDPLADPGVRWSATVSPSWRTVSLTGSPLSALSSTRAAMS